METLIKILSHSYMANSEKAMMAAGKNHFNKITLYIGKKTCIVIKLDMVIKVA